MTEVRSINPGGELRARLSVSPDACVQKLDLVRGLALVIRVDANSYRAASFLDDRILTPSTQGAWMPLARIAEAASRVANPLPLHFIFHTGHVGSTLVSRLLDESGVVLGLREPLPLRTLADVHDVLREPESLLAEDQFASLLGTNLRLWSRGYDWTRAVIVKTTSSAGRLAGPLLAASPPSRALCLNLRAEPYLATLLSGQNSPEDLRGHGPGRIRRLRARTTASLPPLHSMSPGELAALGWLVETASQRDALSEHAGRLMAVDFDRFMTDVAGHMRRVAQHFELPVDERFLEGIGTSATLNRYSKAPEQSFTPEDRLTLLHESRQRNRQEIARGMSWLERLARADRGIEAIVFATNSM